MGVRTVEYAGVTTAWPEQVVKGMQRFAGGLCESHNFHIDSQTCRAKPTAASLNMVLFLKPQRKSSGPSL